MRTPLKKFVRWAVFERDSFTCGYCGRRPPECVLVVDHVVPVARGGGNEVENLVTSCVECNSGKGARQLGEGAIPVDPDALARAAQEMAERTLLLRDLYTVKDEHEMGVRGAVDEALGMWHLMAERNARGDFAERLASAFDPNAVEKLLRRGLSLGQFRFAIEVMLAKWKAIGPRNADQLWWHVTGICWDTVHYREQGR